jgi:PhnB protein
MANVKPIPDGVRTVIPSLTVARCAEALAFYQEALGAELRMNMPAPDGKSVWHAELAIGDSVVFLNDEMPGMSPRPPTPAQPSPVSFWVNVKDCDAAFERAVKHGCTGKMPPADMFWGDRTGTVADPFGYAWTFSTHVKDMTMDEMARAGEAFAKQMGMRK